MPSYHYPPKHTIIEVSTDAGRTWVFTTVSPRSLVAHELWGLADYEVFDAGDGFLYRRRPPYGSTRRLVRRIKPQ